MLRVLSGFELGIGRRSFAMASKPGAWTEPPWTSLGAWKTLIEGLSLVLLLPGVCPYLRVPLELYTLFLPFAVKAVHTNLLGGHEADNWCFHMLCLSVLRYLHGQAWMSISRCYGLTGKYRIQTKGISFEQVDRESNWDDSIILNVIVATLVHAMLPGFQNFPTFWDSRGILILLLLHMGPTEFIYYWLHRALHHHVLFNKYHSHHHSSVITEPVSGSVHSFAEHLMYTTNFALPFLGTWAFGGACMGMFYFYWLFLDVMNSIGHCNFEFIPTWVFCVCPPLKYLVYTPTYHSLHHSHVHTNFALFMPLYDHLGGTADKASDSLYEQVREGIQEKPDFVWLAHGVELLATFHLPFGIASFAAWPYAPKWFLWPLWPLTVPIMILLWVFGDVFTSDTYCLKDLRTETWMVPRFVFQYFLPFEKQRINHLIEHAILKAQDNGVRVISLGALNKNESLNGGGTLFVNKHKDLRIRVVHGNTLTAAIILNELPKDVKEIFITGATSKLGRAIALHLCQRGVRVLMLTTSRDRFETIQSELAPQYQENMVQVEKYQAGQTCQTWVMGKWATPAEQKWAPPGTHFHQFVVPPIKECRTDCTYEKLSAMHLPKEMKGFRSCELTMPRGVVHACHAGGLVHALEGWEHHEVGAIDVSRIDETWDAALKHGFKPV